MVSDQKHAKSQILTISLRTCLIQGSGWSARCYNLNDLDGLGDPQNAKSKILTIYLRAWLVQGGGLAGQVDAIISNLDGLGSKESCQITDCNNFSEGLADLAALWLVSWML